LLVTVPVLGLWPEWIAALARAPTEQAGLGYYEIPWLARLAVAVVIVVMWRSPRAGVLAAAVAIPGLYAISVVLLYAFVAQPSARCALGTSGTVDERRRSPMLTG